MKTKNYLIFTFVLVTCIIPTHVGGEISGTVSNHVGKIKCGSINDLEANTSFGKFNKDDDTATPKSVKIYNNYDFIPGEKVLFDDNFEDATDGEFPGRWKLLEHQGVVNTNNGDKYFSFSDASIGSTGKIKPRLKTSAYLGNSFTVEFDFYIPDEEQMHLHFTTADEEFGKFISIEHNGLLKTNYFGVELNGSYPGNINNGWHHAAFAYKNKQIKCYLDQHRILVIPDCEFEPISLVFAGSEAVRLNNVKIAEGGGMNMLGKILTDGKFVSHAVKFDVGKSIIKGESMGFLTELSTWLKANPGVKLEIGGHTDSDGDDASNITLSQNRAQAVKNQLVSMGIPAERLTAKGYGETKPMDSNASPEGKANNRRVEFVKM